MDIKKFGFNDSNNEAFNFPTSTEDESIHKLNALLDEIETNIEFGDFDGDDIIDGAKQGLRKIVEQMPRETWIKNARFYWAKLRVDFEVSEDSEIIAKFDEISSNASYKKAKAFAESNDAELLEKINAIEAKVQADKEEALREAERKEAERKEVERIEAERQEAERKEAELRERGFDIVDGVLEGYNGNDREIVIPNIVTAIKEYAFLGAATTLRGITIPNSVTHIEENPFKMLHASLLLEDGNERYHMSGDCLIETNTKTLIAGLGNCVIPSDGSVTSIGNEAFAHKYHLTSITIPRSVESIGNYAFDCCFNLTNIFIPNSVMHIGENPFMHNDKLSLLLEAGNKNYHMSGNCLIETNSKTIIAGLGNCIIPTDGSVTSIGERAFLGCTSLTSITIPSNVMSIGDSAFHGCENLTNIVISNGVIKIGTFAFGFCENLTNITISNSVTSVGSLVFYNCDNLMKVIAPKGLIDKRDLPPNCTLIER